MLVQRKFNSGDTAEDTIIEEGTLAIEWAHGTLANGALSFSSAVRQQWNLTIKKSTDNTGQAGINEVVGTTSGGSNSTNSTSSGAAYFTLAAATMALTMDL